MTTPEFVAATLGSLVKLGVGLLTMRPAAGVCAKEDWVAMDDAELVLVGLGGRSAGIGDAATLMPTEDRRTTDGIIFAIGVGCGVPCGEPVMLMGFGCCILD